MVHPKTVEGYDGDLEDLAYNIGNLRYDVLEQFLTALADDLVRQSEGDLKRGRPQLASKLYKTANTIYKSRDEMGDIWNLCKPYMDTSND
jgi:hypothetical protein